MDLVIPEGASKARKISKELFIKLRDSISQLENIDWLEAEEGIYPKSQLFEAPWIEWAKRYPLVWIDLPLTWNRRKTRKTRDIPTKIDQDIYPDYYLQNFHHQTDGYLSDYSAGLYDLQVEILFNGTADAMRRRILAPLNKGLNDFSDKPKASIRILDVATGTGRTLKQIQSSIPKAELLGIDLSESYLRQANRYINSGKGNLVQLLRGNAEKMPFNDSSIHALTCVFLFHELPRKVRQNVLEECFRVLKLGGTLVLADSIQIADSPHFEQVMEDFHKTFHEPYYKDYIYDDIDKRIVESGFTLKESNSYFMTKVWYARKE